MYHYFKLSRIKNVQVLLASKYSVISEMIKFKITDSDNLLDSRIKNIKDKLLYSDYIEKKKLKFGYKTNKMIINNLQYKFEKERNNLNFGKPSLSVALKYLNEEASDLSQLNENVGKEINSIDKKMKEEEKPFHMPYDNVDKYNKVPTKTFEHKDIEVWLNLNEKYKALYEKYLEVSNYSVTNPNLNNDNVNTMLKIRLEDDCSKVPSSWMSDYEIYDELEQNIENVKYGTPNPDTEVSSVPCGGCGALLHCKDVALPGYLPSELFANISDSDLKSITCQRCHFMKHYGTCLDVKVSPDEYPELLTKINDDKKALVILLVDLTDFPCSIWPQLPSIIGTYRHVFVVGNKVDLLPIDSPHFEEQVKDCLTESLIQTGLIKTNIKHICFVSAKTGYGIEKLINKLHTKWNYRSDVYLVGCTNAGKSTLFNTLLQSDFCKSQAVDLIQRATTSPWPGTTLNLLKFPILKPSKKKLYKRTQRLQYENKMAYQEEQRRLKELQKTRNIELATLQSRISHSFKEIYELNQSMRTNNNDTIITVDKIQKFGLDETKDDYKNSRWCYDTPGTIQPDQILHFLTTEELIKVLPRRIISPRTFCIWSGQSIFIAGLGRLDILDVPNFIRCTVFASIDLPITICKVEHADFVYNELLQTEAFVVPINNPNRLKMWPKLKSKDLKTIGIGENESVSDVVLSNAGWIAVTANEQETIIMRAWTPEGRGIYLRTPALLPKSVNFRGMRKIRSPAYHLGKQVYYKLK